MVKLKGKIFDRLSGRFRVPALEESQAGLGVWFTTPLGKTLYEAESQVCRRDTFKIPGYRAVQLGISPGHTLLEALPHKHKFILSSIIDENAACQCDYKALPLPTGTLDTVVLHHVLDFSPEPHRLLNESARIVSAGGYIIIVGFNPFSLFGVSKWLAGLLTRQQVWRHNSLRRARLIDWLQLIGFQLVTSETGGFGELIDKQSQPRLPERVLEWLRQRISTGAFYVVVARKQTIPLNPIRHGVWQTVKIPGFAGIKTIRNNDRGD